MTRLESLQRDVDDGRITASCTARWILTTRAIATPNIEVRRGDFQEPTEARDPAWVNEAGAKGARFNLEECARRIDPTQGFALGRCARILLALQNLLARQSLLGLQNVENSGHDLDHGGP
jgi:hypothetical protein